MKYITSPNQIAIDKFYWLVYLAEERIGKAMNFYGEVRFEVTGFDDKVEFESVTNITPVCLFKH